MPAEGEAAKGHEPSRWGCGLAAVLLGVAGSLGLLLLARNFAHDGGAAAPALTAQLIELKPKSDNRQYHFSRLSNGIQVVNVHDPKALSDAYSMAIEAGSLDDLENFPGLAHFCEHMLFLGTEGYPASAAYDEFVKLKGGYLNAYTADETTVYYSELSKGSLSEAFDRFGDFFRAPLFDKSLVEKEVEAIDSEHAKNVQSPPWRLWALFNSLANPESPVSRFHTGNKETLYTKPGKEGANPVDALKTWFNSHYCPSRMRFVSFSSLPLQEQLKLSEKYFGNITAKDPSCESEPRRSWAEPAPWPKQRLGKWLSVLGTTPSANVVLYFPLPDLTAEYKSQPIGYIHYSLTYGGEGSLTTVLRDDLGLVTDISVSFSTGSPGGMLMVYFGLTEAGRSKPDGVLDVFFQYVGTLRNAQVSMELYNSLANVHKLSWDWSQRSGPSDTASAIAERLTRMPAEKVLSGDDLIETPDPVKVASLLKLLVPENMNAALVDSQTSFDAPAKVRMVPYYGINYTMEELSGQFPVALARWQRWVTPEGSRSSADQLREVLHSPKLQAPKPPQAIQNVPKQVATTYMSAETRPAPGQRDAEIVGPYPSLLVAPHQASLVEARQLRGQADGLNRNDSLWYRQGWVSTSPKVKVKAVFRPPRTIDYLEAPVADRMRLDLYATLFKKELGPKVFDQSVAGAYYDISLSLQGIALSFEGFEPLLPGLIDSVTKEVRKGFKVTQLALDRAVEDLSHSLQSYSEMPVTYAVSDRNLLVTAGAHSKEEGLAALKTINATGVGSSMSELLLGSALQFDALVMGNLGEDQATRTAAAVRRGVVSAASSTWDGGEVRPVSPVVRVGRPVELRKLNPRQGDTNGVVVVTLLRGVSTVEGRVIFGLLGTVVGQLAYNELRTKQQLGYVVHAGDVQISNVQGISTVVQGVKADADAMEAAVERLYFEEMPAYLQEMTDSEFQTFRKSFRNQLLRPPLGYSEEFDHFWSPISVNISCNGLRNEMLMYLDEVLESKQLLVEAWSDLIHPKSGTRDRSVVKYFAGSVPARPSLEASKAVWKQRGINDAALQQLAKDHGATVVVDRADSSARAELAKLGGYYPRHIECRLPQQLLAKRNAQRNSPTVTFAPAPHRVFAQTLPWRRRGYASGVFLGTG